MRGQQVGDTLFALPGEQIVFVSLIIRSHCLVVDSNTLMLSAVCNESEEPASRSGKTLVVSLWPIYTFLNSPQFLFPLLSFILTLSPAYISCCVCIPALVHQEGEKGD